MWTPPFAFFSLYMPPLSQFRPPKPSKAWIWLCLRLFPFYTKYVENLSFKFLENPLHPLAFTRDKSVVIAINHGDRQDPLVVIALAKHMNESIYCLVAREVFDWYHGLLGWLFQKLGGYSVNRGVADFRSIHTTQLILARSNKKLVVFPEAEITGDEIRVHDLNPSFIHLLLESQEHIAKKDPAHALWILPVGVSYVLKSSLHSALSKLLKQIENRIGIETKDDKRPQTDKEIEHRVLFTMQKYLHNLSMEHQFSFDENKIAPEQVRRLARHICEEIAAAIKIDCQAPEAEEEFMYLLRNRLSEIADNNSTFLHNLDQVERLLILQRILRCQTSPIEICRIMDFLEAELFNRMTRKGKQLATIAFGEPIALLPLLQGYAESKEDSIEKLSDSVRGEIQRALNKARGNNTP